MTDATNTSTISKDNCPACGSGRLYTLSDDRKMCRDCRKKFTPRPKVFRLPVDQRKQIAESFWSMVPTEEGANELDLNRKTLQRYYRHLRREIAWSSDTDIAEMLQLNMNQRQDKSSGYFKQSSGKIFPTCHIALLQGKPRILADRNLQITDKVLATAPCAKIHYRNKGNSTRFKLDNLYIRKFRSNDLIEAFDQDFHTIRKFWAFSNQQMAHYKVINNNNLFFFLKEMEFRFNSTKEQDAIRFLISSLSSFPES